MKVTQRGRALRAMALLSGAATVLASPALAQDAADSEIVVVGQRLAQERAIEIRRESDGIVDAISSDDIGRLADKNVAENVERLPGVSLKYDQGEGRFVSIRGINGDLNNVTVNGVDLGSPDGDTRVLPLDVISGQLLSRVEVIKTVTPDMDAQAVGGAVNIVLQSPFDYDDPFFIAGRIQAGEHELNSTTPYAADASIGGIFGSRGEFGFLLGANFSQRDFRTYGVYPDDWAPAAGSLRGDPTNIKFTTYDLLRERTGAAASFEWRPNDDHRVYAQALYSLFTEDEYRQRYRLDFGTVTYNPDGVTATATGGERRQDLRLEEKDKSVLNFSIGGEHALGLWEIDYVASAGHNELDEPNHVWLFRSAGLAGGSINSNLDFGSLLYTATPVAEAPPSALQFRQLTIQQNIAEEDIYVGEINFRRNLPSNGDSYWQFGLRLRDAEKMQDNANLRYDRGTAPNRFTLADFDLLGDPTATYIDDRIYPNSPTIDQNAMIAYTAANLGGPTIVLNDIITQQNDILSDYTIGERVTAAYGMLNWDFGWVSVLAGARIEQTEVDVQGFRTAGLDTLTPTIETISAQSDYVNVLPGLHIRMEPRADVILRLSYSNTLGRPQYPQLSPGQDIDDSVATPVISGGNPALEPFLSHNLDFAIEYYFARGGILSASIFNKYIEDPIFSASRFENDVTFAGVTYPVVEISQPENANSARISGIEFGYRQQYTFLPGALGGLGMAASLTLVDSELDHPDRGDLPMPRQSDLIWGAQLFYQMYGIEAVLAYHFTDSYQDTISDDAETDTFFNSFTRVDAKVSYDLTDNVSLFLEAQNLNDEVLWEYQGGRPDWFIGYEQYGRTTYLGVSARF